MRLAIASAFLVACGAADQCATKVGVHYKEKGETHVVDKIENISDADSCCALCSANVLCHSWVWHTAEQKLNPLRCKLLEESPAELEKHKDSGFVSGAGAPAPPPSPPPSPGPVPPRGDRPNILLLFPDQWRFDWAGFTYPQTSAPNQKVPLQLPTVMALAERGVRFSQAYVPAPVCAPSRSCLASGRDYDDMSATAGVPSNGHDYNIDVPTIYRQLKDAGYHTMTTGKDDLTKGTHFGFKTNPKYPGCSYCRDGDGLYHQAELGFSDALRMEGKHGTEQNKPDPFDMYGFMLRNHTVPLENGTMVNAWESYKACFSGKIGTDHLCDKSSYPQLLYEDNFVAASAVKLLQRWKAGSDKDQPFFLQVSFVGPHPPFSVTADMHDGVAGIVWPNATDDTAVIGGSCEATGLPSDINTAKRCDYAAEVINLDALFRQVLDEVEALGEANRTLVCMSSDHGEMLGDHGDFGKTLPWQGSASVPLICAGPGVAKNRTVSDPVGTLDMAGTFLDFAKAEPASGMTTVSLRQAYLDAAPSGVERYRPFVASGLNKWRMVIQKDPSDGRSYKLVCCQGDCPQAPSTAPKPRNGWTTMLIDVDNDPYDMHDLSGKASYKELVQRMIPLLPSAYAAGCSGKSDAPLLGMNHSVFI